MSQFPNHKADHRHIHKGFAGLWQALIVFAEPSIAVEPCEGALHYPATRQHYKAFLPFLLLHYRKLPPQRSLCPLDQLPSIASIGPYQGQTAEAPPVPMARVRLLDALIQRLEYTSASISVLNRGGSHYYQQHQTQRVHNQVSLASPYVLVFIIGMLFSPLFIIEVSRVDFSGLTANHNPESACLCYFWLLFRRVLSPRYPAPASPRAGESAALPA
jgi:hypothetical protein